MENEFNHRNYEARMAKERRVVLPTTPVECEHGYDHCPICDALPTGDDVVERLDEIARRSPTGTDK